MAKYETLFLVCLDVRQFEVFFFDHRNHMKLDRCRICGETNIFGWNLSWSLLEVETGCMKVLQVVCIYPSCCTEVRVAIFSGLRYCLSILVILQHNRFWFLLSQSSIWSYYGILDTDMWEGEINIEMNCLYENNPEIFLSGTKEPSLLGLSVNIVLGILLSKIYDGSTHWRG